MWQEVSADVSTIPLSNPDIGSENISIRISRIPESLLAMVPKSNGFCHSDGRPEAHAKSY